jgi:hypothetical protein
MRPDQYNAMRDRIARLEDALAKTVDTQAKAQSAAAARACTGPEGPVVGILDVVRPSVLLPSGVVPTPTAKQPHPPVMGGMGAGSTSAKLPLDAPVAEEIVDKPVRSDIGTTNVTHAKPLPLGAMR